MWNFRLHWFAECQLWRCNCTRSNNCHCRPWWAAADITSTKVSMNHVLKFLCHKHIWLNMCKSFTVLSSFLTLSRLDNISFGQLTKFLMEYECNGLKVLKIYSLNTNIWSDRLYLCMCVAYADYHIRMKKKNNLEWLISVRSYEHETSWPGGDWWRLMPTWQLWSPTALSCSLLSVLQIPTWWLFHPSRETPLKLSILTLFW